jgi:hypothetical protein
VVVEQSAALTKLSSANRTCGITSLPAPENLPIVAYRCIDCTDRDGRGIGYTLRSSSRLLLL